MSIRAFGRLRVGNAPPLVSAAAPTALKVGELVATRQGVMYLGVGAGTGSNATGYVTFSPTGGAVQVTQVGGIVFTDDAAQNSTNTLVLRAPVDLTLTGFAAQTGTGTCNLQILSGGKVFTPAATASNTTSYTILSGNSVQRRVEQGQPIQLAISNASNLTSLIVQLDWTE